MLNNRTSSLPPAQRKTVIILLCCFVVVALLYLVVFSESSLVSIMGKKAELETQENKNREMREKNTDLVRDVELARNDLHYLEQVARERNMLKKNETLLILPPEKKKGKK